MTEDIKTLVTEMDREMSAKSFRFFFEDVLGFQYNHHHEQWVDCLDKHRYYVVKAARDHGKSTLFMSYALWIAAFQPGTSIMIFSHSLEQTLEHMRFIRMQIDNHDVLKHLKESGGRPWAKSYFEFTNGSRIMGKSVGGATRGFHPEVVVCDDILWGTSGTELERAADWFYSVLLPVVHDEGRLMMVGTPFSYNDLYTQLERAETFHVETFPAMDIQGVPLWPGRWNKEALERRRLSMPAMQFAREYLCEPIHDVASMFPMDVLEKARDPELRLLSRAEHEYDEHGEDVGVFGQHFIGWDPAIASDKNADYTAMVVTRVLDDGTKQVVHAVHEKGLGSEAQKRQMVLLNSRFQPDLIELEGNNFQRMLEVELRTLDIPIKTFMTTRQRKESLFMSLLLAFEQGTLRTPYGDEKSREFTSKLETELNRFGMTKAGRLESVGTHDDLAMGLALANWATKEFSGSIALLDDYMPGFDEWLRGEHKSQQHEWFVV